jgi:YidC/Oxa1 family membrane protein insertase
MKEGMNFQRTLLWVVFGSSLFMLYNNWQHHNGRPGFLEPPKMAESGKPAPGAAAPTAPAVSDASIPTAGAPAATADPAAAATVPAPPATTAAPRVRVETDVFRAEIDPDGATLARVELLKQRVAPDWHAAGLMALITGKRQDLSANEVLLDTSPDRRYNAQTGLIGSAGGAPLPNHRTPFARLDGPTTLADGQDSLEVRFAADAGDVRLVKVYTFKRGRYDIGVRHEITNTAAAPVSPSLYLQLLRDGNKPEGQSGAYSTFTGPAVYTEADKFHKIEFSDIEKNKAAFPKSANDGWVAMVQHYFVSAWVPAAGAARENFARMIDKNLYSIGSILPLGAIAPGATEFTRIPSGPFSMAATFVIPTTPCFAAT